MTRRTLTITLSADRRAAPRRAAGKRAAARSQGEVLTFESATELGLVERTENGGVCCSFDAVRIDMRLTADQALAA